MLITSLHHLTTGNMKMNANTMLMHRYTGSVDTYANWSLEEDFKKCLENRTFLEVVESESGVRCQNGKTWIEK